MTEPTFTFVDYPKKFCDFAVGDLVCFKGQWRTVTALNYRTTDCHHKDICGLGFDRAFDGPCTDDLPLARIPLPFLELLKHPYR